MLAAVDTYSVLQFVHVLGAMLWIGGAAALTILAEFAVRSRNGERIATLARDADRLGKIYFIPVAVIVLALGFYLVEDGGWGYQPWIVYALVAFGVSSFLCALYRGPESGRIGKLIQSEGGESPAVRTRLSRLLWLGRLDLLIIISIVFAMVTKVGQ